MRSALLLLLAAAAPAAGQFDLPGAKAAKSFADVAEVTAVFVPAKAKPGEAVTLRVTVTPAKGCYTYPVNPPAGQFSKNVIKPPGGDFVFAGAIADPPGAKTKPGAEAGTTDTYYPGETTWELKGYVAPTATAGPKQVSLAGTKLQACNDQNCFNSKPDDLPTAAIEVLPGPPVTPPAIAVAPPAADKSDVVLPGSATAVPAGFWVFLATAAVWGWVSLATPCVFPMIPITVSLFLKQSQQSVGGAVKLATVYCLTIIVVLGLSAYFLLSVFRKLSIDPYMNIFLGGLFVVFALSLFGMYDISLPGFLLRYTDKKRGAGGMIGTVFGVLAFSIVSFTCVAPFLGGFAGMAASGRYSEFQLILGGLAFATAFASPFFVLAMFPSLLKKMPRSGGWLDTVKAVMGFLEVAAALKFFRTAELTLLAKPEYFTYDVVLAGWVAVAGACGLYLLNIFRLPHDEEKPNIGVLRLIFALGFLGVSVYLLPALFKQRPTGVVFAWVDSFLLPDTETGEKWAIDLDAEVTRISGEMAAWEKLNSPAAPKPAKRKIFVDFTGVTCTNCKYNEKNVFSRPEIKELIEQYTGVQLYTDTVPAGLYKSPPEAGARDAAALANLVLQRSKFGTEQLPLYVILEPLAAGGYMQVGVYDEGKINNPARFAAFLRAGLE